MGGFSNPVTNAAGQLVRNVMKSINYVAGLTGWQISKNGDAEFNLGTFRGSISITASNGSKIVIDASSAYPTMFFYSKDGTNYSQISLINAVSTSQADLWVSSGPFTPADGIARAIRVYLAGFTQGQGRMSVDRLSDGAILGGIARVFDNMASIGYYDQPINKLNEAIFDANDIRLNTSRDIRFTPTNGGLFVRSKPICTAVGSIGPQFHTAGSTVAAGFGVMPGSPSFTITKEYNADSHLKIDFHSTFYANGAAGVTFGVNVQGGAFNGNFTMAQIANTNASNLNHSQASGTGRISVPTAGAYTITLIWYRNGGAGTLQVDSGDYFSVSATEVAA